MDSSTLVAVGAIAAVVVVGLLLRGGSSKGADGSPSPPSEPARSERERGDDDEAFEEAEPDSGEEADDDAWDPDEVVAVTSDGYAFLPDVHAVRLLPPQEEGEAWKAGESARAARVDAAVAASWHSGDFTGARVVRGGGEDPWRLEALGRDGEFTLFSFETKDAADAALRLLEKRDVIRLGTDEDGNPMPPSAEQFAEARRIYEETEQALAMEPGPDDEA